MELTLASHFSHIYLAPEEEAEIDLKTLHIPAPIWSRSKLPASLQLLEQAHQENRLVVYDFGREGEAEPMLLGMLSGKPDAPFVLICPGGSFVTVDVPNEGVPVAAALNERGINAFVLLYSVGMGSHHKALQELQDSLVYIFRNARKHKIDTRNYQIMGFSVGGFYAIESGLSRIDYEGLGLPRPGGIAACYPLVTMAEDKADSLKSRGVKKGLKILANGPFESPEEAKAHDLLAAMTEDYPDLFIWQGKEDALIPYKENAKALSDKAETLGVRHQLDTFHLRKHGVGLGEDTAAAGWLDDYLAFVRAG